LSVSSSIDFKTAGKISFLAFFFLGISASLPLEIYVRKNMLFLTVEANFLHRNRSILLIIKAFRARSLVLFEGTLNTVCITGRSEATTTISSS
jgi:hypothetical protein